MKNDDVLSMYLKEINKVPLLSREEEIELAEKAKKGDKAAKDKIIKANLRFVVKVAKKYQNHGLDLTDLISEGNIGLMTAIDKFEPSRGYHFISYAVWWINQSILKALSEKSRAIRLPLNRANELVRIEYASNLINGYVTEAEEVEQIAQMTNMTEAKVRELLSISNDMVSLDAKVSSKQNDDKLNKLHRVLTINDVKKIQGFWTIQKMEMKNVQTDHSTVILVKNTQYNVKIDKALFTVAKLEKGL